MKFASLCILSFQRLDFTKIMLPSLLETLDAKAEVIVHDNGSDNEVKDYLLSLLKERKISWLILNGGDSMSIGKAIQNCLRVASGDYLFKIDNDLKFKKGWLSKSIKILEENKNIGCLSHFNYRHYDPNDNRFNIIKEEKDYNIVDDFVSSIYGFRRELWDKYGKELGTDGWHQFVKSQGYNLAITKEDMVENFGFGANSIFVGKDGKAREVSDLPLIL